MELNFDAFYIWTSRNLNIDLSAYKEKQLQRRISTVMKQAGAASLEEYAAEIKKNPAVKQAFLDYITINVTEFFRNKELFEEFEKLTVGHLAPKFGKLKMWSAACSIGAEPYSMAMITDKHNIKLAKPILATDIDTLILERATEAVFRSHEIRNVSLSDKTQYFKHEDDTFILDDKIKQKVRFQQHDLILEKFETGFHAVVCRNVTIYFKNDVKEMIYQKISDSLVPGGLFFTGATETIYRPDVYGLKKVTSFIYEKM